ncbi:hypothetical protein B0T16DRAFT_449708 [Cercophora newfieldiana]|uniref:Uncharacterized protein n=1 Tax=Cercophora newfieldiana TaxID=92897 RepID=A0AA39XSZ3_9PEZI|nr:hypothetical protein B0T16DRAFT_449708 [Cercophora newfieldiana]
MSTLHHPHPGRGTTRIGTSGLRIRTHNFTDVSTSNIRAKGIASSDWRTTSASSPADSLPEKTLPSKRYKDTRSSESMASFEVEMRSVRYRPKEEQAPWEMVLSAPGGRFPGSSISTDQFVCEGIPVQFKNAKPMTVNANGEEIVLENSFTFDIVTLDSDQSSFDEVSPQPTLGVLKRIGSHFNRYRKLPQSHDSSDLPADIQSMLDGVQSLVDSGSLPSMECGRNSMEHNMTEMPNGPGSSAIRTSSGSVAVRNVPSSIPRPQGSALGEDHGRFQNMLNRLNKLSIATDVVERPTNNLKAADPAILFAKPKDTTNKSEATGSGKDKFYHVSRPRTDWSRKAEKQSSESDYVTVSSEPTLVGSSSGKSSVGTLGSTEGSRVHRTTVLPPISELRREEPLESPTKRLNPAAAEFKSTFDEKVFPISPKKMTRTPLTNLFPEATQKDAPADRVDPSVTRELGASQVVDSIANHIRQPPGLPAPYTTITSTHGLAGLRPPPGFGFPAETIPSLPSHHLVPPLPPLPVNTPLLGSLFDTYPTPTLLPPPLDLAQMHASMNGFGTFPGPLMAPRIPPGSVDMPPLVTPVQAGPAPFPPPLYGADRKINRPNFPVTQKPRDHDPIKQQQYEAYLEWRKANEPGYHMKCKMRQAQRVVRQFQQKVPDRPGALNSKSIIEQAKAAVGAAAQRAAAEKQLIQESVREELKSKVRERSEDCAKGENVPPPKTAIAEKNIGAIQKGAYLAKNEPVKGLKEGLVLKNILTTKQKSKTD